MVFAKEKEDSFDLKKLDLAFEENEINFLNSITGNPRSLRAWSKRGDMRLFLGKFEDAKSDYEKMIQLDPALEVSHWRLGIAYFYLKITIRPPINFKFIITSMRWTGKMESGVLCHSSKVRG